MQVIKKSLDLTGDAAHAIDEYIQNNPGMSFTLIANQALKHWLENKHIDLKLNMEMPVLSTFVKKSANMHTEYIEEIDRYRHKVPGLNLTLILNVALLQWLKKPKFTTPKPYTNSDIDQFMNENSELMDELAK